MSADRTAGGIFATPRERELFEENIGLHAEIADLQMQVERARSQRDHFERIADIFGDDIDELLEAVSAASARSIGTDYVAIVVAHTDAITERLREAGDQRAGLVG